MFERWAEEKLFEVLENSGTGCICYSPLAQGALTNRYINDVPSDSRAARIGTTIAERYLDEEKLLKVKKLNEIAENRNQSMAQMALAWVLRKKEVTSVLIGASRPEQIEDNVKTIQNLYFSEDEIMKIENILK
jgi:L-glyceraldehyde 3-phosphate reductase